MAKACTWCGGQDSAIHQCPPEACTYAVPGSFDATLNEDKLRELMARIARPMPPPLEVHGISGIDWASHGDPLADLRAGFNRFTGDMLFGPPAFVFTRSELRMFRDIARAGGYRRIAAEAQEALDQGGSYGSR